MGTQPLGDMEGVQREDRTPKAETPESAETPPNDIEMPHSDSKVTGNEDSGETESLPFAMD